MDKYLLLAALLFLAGILHLILPVYFTMTGLVLCLSGFGFLVLRWFRKRRKFTLYNALCTLMSCCVIGLILCMSLIAGYGSSTDPGSAETADYAIVLGCQVKKDNSPSAALESRILLAADLLESNPDLTVIVSGGMGSDEHITEAACMYRELTAINSAWSDRIILEENATTTRENLIYSMDIITSLGGTDAPVVLVTSDYHMARAVYIAGTLKLDAAGVSSVTENPFFRFHYCLREVFSFVKAFVTAA